MALCSHCGAASIAFVAFILPVNGALSHRNKKNEATHTQTQKSLGIKLSVSSVFPGSRISNDEIVN